MVDRISREELKAKLDRGDDFVLVDASPETAYRKSHLPRAISIPSDDIMQAATEQLPDRKVDIVVYCANGPCKRSRLATERLEALGYQKVRDYHQGKADWADAGLPVERA